MTRLIRRPRLQLALMTLMVQPLLLLGLSCCVAHGLRVAPFAAPSMRAPMRTVVMKSKNKVESTEDVHTLAKEPKASALPEEEKSEPMLMVREEEEKEPMPREELDPLTLYLAGEWREHYNRAVAKRCSPTLIACLISPISYK